MKAYLLILCIGEYSSKSEYKIACSLDEQKIISLENSLSKDIVWLLTNKHLFFNHYFDFISKEKENFFQKIINKQKFSEMTINIFYLLIKECSYVFYFKTNQVDYI